MSSFVSLKDEAAADSTADATAEAPQEGTSAPETTEPQKEDAGLEKGLEKEAQAKQELEALEAELGALEGKLVETVEKQILIEDQISLSPDD